MTDSLPPAPMALRDVEQALRVAIATRTTENDAVVFQKLQNLVSQRPAEVTQLEPRLQIIYNSSTSIAPLDLFVEILYITREHLTPDSIIKTWWDLVLRPALSRAHMPRAVIRHAIEVVMVGLSEGKTGFRRHLVGLFTLGVPSLNSVEEAIESVSMSDEEKTQTAQWKESLIEILTKDAERHPKHFFEEINKEFVDPTSRLSLVELLSKLATDDNFPIIEFGNSSLVMTLLLSLFIDNSASVFTLELSTLTMLIPCFAVKAPARLKEILPELLAVLARAICWQPSGVEYDEPPDIWHRNLQVREDLPWQRLETSFELTASGAPDAMRYFTFLYGVYPVNCITFLQEPVDYLVQHNCRSPFTATWEGVLYYEEEIRSRCDILLRNHIIHPALIRGTAEQELSSQSPWSADVANLITACSLLDVRNATSASQGAFGEISTPFNIWSEGGEILQSSDGNSTPIGEHGAWSTQGRTPISIRQLMEIHSTLRSGLPINIVNDYPELPSTPRVHATQSPAYEVAAMTLSTTLDRSSRTNGAHSPEVLSLTSTQRDEAKDEAISILQRELLLVMNELNFETYLRRHHLAEIGTLQKQSVQTRSSEMERQRMRNQIKYYEKEIERYKHEKRDLQQQIDRYRESGDTFSHSTRQQLHKMKKEKDTWLLEANEIRLRDSETQDVLKAKSERLSETEIQIVKLENEKKENEANIAFIKDYQRQIEVLRKSEQIWHADHRRLKWQDDMIQQLKAKLNSMQSIIDSEANANSRLVDENQHWERRVDELEYELEQLKLSTSRNPKRSQFTRDREQALKSRGDTLEEENAKLRAIKAQLEEQLEQEKARREAHEMHERLLRARSRNDKQAARHLE